MKCVSLAAVLRILEGVDKPGYYGGLEAGQAAARIAKLPTVRAWVSDPQPGWRVAINPCTVGDLGCGETPCVCRYELDDDEHTEGE